MESVKHNIPLVVDLDSTLICSDLLYESLITKLKTSPYEFFLIPIWLYKGKSVLKEKLATNIDFDPSSLPYNTKLINFLRSEHEQGRKIILCTASNEHFANAIAKYLGFFDEVLASNSHYNLKGVTKAKELVQQYGEKGFDYAGNSMVDIAVWKRARKAIIVNASRTVLQKAQEICQVEHIFEGTKLSFSLVFRVIRLHQWLKNLLLCAPIISAHKIHDPTLWLPLLTAFLSFSFCASSVYLINDILDIEDDRKHPQKCTRPIPTGLFPIPQACILTTVLLFSSFILASFINIQFFKILLTYLCITTAYSLLLKRLLLVDCITLAILYTIRIIAGSIVITTYLSFWLLTFSIFFFLNLSFIKRYTELSLVVNGQTKKVHGRAYQASDLSLIQNFGVASAYTSVLIFALYLNSDIVKTLYSHPDLLWLTLPIIIFWVSWMWMQTHRGTMNDDPVLFAISDKISLLGGLLFSIIFIGASCF